MLNKNELEFCNNIFNGDTQHIAYKKAFPKADKLSLATIDAYASKLINEPRIQQALDDMKNKQMDELIKNNVWSKDMAIQSLKYVLAQNLDEMNRCISTHKEEQEYIQECIENAKKDKDKHSLKLIKLAKNKTPSIYKSTNEGIIGAIKELNSVCKIDVINAEVQATIVFKGEEDLED